MFHELVLVFVEKKFKWGMIKVGGTFMSRHTFALKKKSKIQRSLSASCFRGDNKIVVLQTLSGRHYTSALCSVGTLFLRPASVEERQEG